MKEILLSGLTIVSPLAFPLTLKSGRVIETVGDAASYFGTLTEEKRGHRRWQIAVRMLIMHSTNPRTLKLLPCPFKRPC
jgi:hypothetical protein